MEKDINNQVIVSIAKDVPLSDIVHLCEENKSMISNVNIITTGGENERSILL